MAFKKVVSASTRVANIGVFKHKKMLRDRRIRQATFANVLGYVRLVALSQCMNFKMYSYEQLRNNLIELGEISEEEWACIKRHYDNSKSYSYW